jgi:glucokinase
MIGTMTTSLGTTARRDHRELVLAVDIGGTKLAAGLIDATGTILSSAPVPTPKGRDAIFSALAGVVDEALDTGRRLRRAEPLVCGVGCGGPMVRRGEVVSPLNIVDWHDVPLRSWLAERTGLRVAVDNDAKALALAEGWLGAARGQPNFIGMVVSTGVGGGIVVDGHLLDGGDGNAGHIGHVIVEPDDGHLCGCGARGCLEAEASGLAIERISGRPARAATPELIERTGTLVGRAVASVANLLDLRLAVVAGSVALGFGAPFFAAAQAEIDIRSQLAFSRGTVIRPAGLGGDAPLIGAAALGWRLLGRSVGIA